MSNVRAHAMPIALIVGLVVLACAALLVVGMIAVALVWRYLPLSRVASAALFTIVATLLATPVPVNVGVGAMVYPVAVLYKDMAQLQWHIGWYLSSPHLLLPSLVVTAGLAYWVSSKLLPNISNRSPAHPRVGEKR
jgi:hypothetical protein